jgi:hypothetical protein
MMEIFLDFLLALALIAMGILGIIYFDETAGAFTICILPGIMLLREILFGKDDGGNGYDDV